MIQRQFVSISAATLEVSASIKEFSAAIKMAGRQINRFAFRVWLRHQPLYLRPLMRFAYWCEERLGWH